MKNKNDYLIIHRDLSNMGDVQEDESSEDEFALYGFNRF